MINQVTLVGRLTKDPELKMTLDGIAVTNVTLAVNRQYRNQNGVYDADFVQCQLWRKTAENTAQYCRKGSVVGITGRIQTRNYENSEGRRIYVTEVVAESVQFLGKKQMDEEIPPAFTRNQEKEKALQPFSSNQDPHTLAQSNQT